MTSKPRKRRGSFENAREWAEGSMKCGAVEYLTEDAHTKVARCRVTGGKCNYGVCPTVKKNQYNTKHHWQHLSKSTAPRQSSLRVTNVADSPVKRCIPLSVAK